MAELTRGERLAQLSQTVPQRGSHASLRPAPPSLERPHADGMLVPAGGGAAVIAPDESADGSDREGLKRPAWSRQNDNTIRRPGRANGERTRFEVPAFLRRNQ